MRFKVDPCWFGERRVVYVRVELPDHRGGDKTKHFVVHGHSLDRVTSEVFRALAKAFGWHGGGHPRIGRRGNKHKTTKR